MTLDFISVCGLLIVNKIRNKILLLKINCFIDIYLVIDLAIC